MPRTWKKILASLCVASGIALGGATMVHATLYDPQPTISSTLHLSTSAVGYPQQLIIPKLHIYASVQHVGLTTGDRMRAPSNFTDVAWYEYGTPPGAQGSAVMAGHLNNGLGLNGVFASLSTLSPGDDVFVTTSTGKRLHFVVQRLATYPYQSVPATIFSATDTARLNLITCNGTPLPHSPVGFTYDKRLVVYTVLRAS